MSASSAVDRAHAVLDGIEKAREAATPGPWTAATAPAEGSDETHAEYLTRALDPEAGRPLWVAWAPTADVHGDELDYVVPVVTGDGPTSRENAAFVALAHALTPRLVAAVRAALALADEWAAHYSPADTRDKAVHARQSADALRSTVHAALTEAETNR